MSDNYSGADNTTAFGGTAMRLFAVVAVAVIATNMDVDDTTALNASQGVQSQGFVLSACYLLNARHLMSLFDAFPLTTVFGAVFCSVALAVAMSLAAGSRERQDMAARNQYQRRQQRHLHATATATCLDTAKTIPTMQPKDKHHVMHFMTQSSGVPVH